MKRQLTKNSRISKASAGAAPAHPPPVKSKKQDKETKLDRELNKYIQKHGLSVDMHTNYMLDAFSLRKDNYSYMVLVMDTERVKEGVTNVTYADYVNMSDDELKQNAMQESKYLRSGRYFQLVSRASENQPIISQCQRYFGPKYQKSLPCMSGDQKLICLPRSTDSKDDCLIDIFDCTNQGQDDQFWRRENELDTSDENFVCSLRLANSQEMKDYKGVIFSENNRFACVQFKDKIQFFDVQAAEVGQIPRMQAQVRLSNNTVGEEQSKVREYFSERRLHDPQTYDSILGIYLIDEEPSEKSQLLDCWIILQSKQHKQIHLLKLSNLPQQAQEDPEQTRCLGGRFIKSKHQIRFKIQDDDDQDFWDHVSAMFTNDGKQATIQTPFDVYLLMLDEKREDMYLKYAKIPYLQDKSEFIKSFAKDSSQILFCEQNERKSYIQFYASGHENIDGFSNTKISCRGNVKVMEAFEFERNEQTVFRVTAIRDSESLMSWEIIKKDGKEQKYFRQVNSNKLSTFRWPFYAYATASNTIALNALSKTEFLVHHVLDEDNSGVIQQMQFSYNANLYVLYYTQHEEKIYRLKVKKASHSRERFNQSNEIRNDLMSQVEFAQTQELAPAESMVAQDSLSKVIFSRHRDESRSVYWLNAIEQSVGLEEVITILMLKGTKLEFIYKIGNEEPKSKIYEQKVKDLQQINKNNFVILDDKNNLRLLTVEYKGHSFYEEDIVYRDTAHNIKKILADTNQLYVLSHNGPEYFLKTFKLAPDLELVPTGFISNLEQTNPIFIDEFKKSSMINSNILIANDQKLVKIYHSENENVDASIQNYFNYLSKPKHPDRQMPISLLRNCPKHNRLLVQFNYPIGCRNKKVTITPYISDNSISMNSQRDNSMITWVSRTNDSTRIFQFSPSRNMLLNEFDLVGVLKKQSIHQKAFDAQQILAQDQQKLRFLVSPEAEEFLKQMQIIQVDETHNCKVLHKIDTEKITLDFLRASQDHEKVTLFDFMFDIKSSLDVRFEFGLKSAEQTEIVMVCKLMPSEYILAIVIIQLKENDSGHIAHQVFSDQKQADLFNDLFGQMRLLKRQSALVDEKEKFLRKIFEKFHNAKKFAISKENIIIWSKRHILFGKLEEIREDVSGERNLLLTKSKFVIHASRSQKNKKFQQLVKRTSSNNQEIELDSENEEVMKSAEDCIEDIICCNTIQAKKFIKSANSYQEKKDRKEKVVLKIKGNEDKVSFLQYKLEEDVEVTGLTASKESEVFFNAKGEFMVSDPEMGLVNLKTKEVLHEYHIDGNEIIDLMQIYDMRQGTKLVQTYEGKYFILPNKLFMPYSYLSVVQHYQDEAYDKNISNFYTEDYYKLDGQTQFHKLMFNTVLLGKLIDDYWGQNQEFMTALLTKIENLKIEKLKQEVNNELNKEMGKNNVGIGKSIAKVAALKSFADIQNGVEYDLEEGDDPLRTLMTLNCDSLINKILHHLSKLPIQYSFQRIQDKLEELVEYSRFYDYVSAWPQQTDQMKVTTVLYTDMQQGIHYESENCSYLTDEFFAKFPLEKPQAINEKDGTIAARDSDNPLTIQTQKSEESSIDDDAFQRVESSQQHQEVVRESDFDGKSQQQVIIHIQQVDWLTKKDYGQKFLETLASSTDCQPLFTTQAVKDIVGNLWKNTRSFFVYNFFLSFLFLNYLPVIMMALMITAMEQEESSVWTKIMFYAFAVAFLLGTFWNVQAEVQEVIKKKWKYLLNIENYFQLAMSALNVSLVIYTVVLSDQIIGFIPEKLHSSIDVNKLRVVMILAILSNTIELFSRIRVFDFFAYFVRQITEIVEDALPLGTMLAFIVLAQTFLFWILDQNSEKPAYEGVEGFGNCLINSYRLALGDFEIVDDNFIADSQNVFLFWFIFFVGTLVSLLIILNMVIAIMGGTFGRVEAEKQAYIDRAKLSLVINNMYRFPAKMREQLDNNKYMLSLEVDPEVDSIEKDGPDARCNKNYMALQQQLERQGQEIDRVVQTLDSLCDRQVDQTGPSSKKGVVDRDDDQSESEEEAKEHQKQQ